MNKKHYYQASLLAPLILPLLLLPIEFIGPIFLISLVVGGIPYLLFASVIFLLSIKRDIKFLEKTSLVAPPIFGIFIGISYLIYEFVTNGLFMSHRPGYYFRGIFAFIIYSCGFGYFYVVLVRLIAYRIYDKGNHNNTREQNVNEKS